MRKYAHVLYTKYSVNIIMIITFIDPYKGFTIYKVYEIVKMHDYNIPIVSY